MQGKKNVRALSEMKIKLFDNLMNLVDAKSDAQLADCTKFAKRMFREYRDKQKKEENARILPDIATILTPEIMQSVKELVGGNYQVIMLTEEISELQEHLSRLQKQLCKYLRHKDEDEKQGVPEKERPCVIGIAEEMADVDLMLREVEWMLDIENEVRVHYPEKITRLLERIEVIKEENSADAKP